MGRDSRDQTHLVPSECHRQPQNGIDCGFHVISFKTKSNARSNLNCFRQSGDPSEQSLQERMSQSSERSFGVRGDGQGGRVGGEEGWTRGGERDLVDVTHVDGSEAHLVSDVVSCHLYNCRCVASSLHFWDMSCPQGVHN